MKVIIISGKARHGKDTVAAMMASELRERGKKVLVTHYADPLKFVCTKFFGWNGEKDDEGRSLLQYVGTDIVRKFDENFWVDHLGRLLLAFKDEWDYVIIGDARFPNEIDSMRDLGHDVTHVRVVRTVVNTALTQKQQTHESEVALDNTLPDLYVNNYGTLEQLNDVVASLIKENGL